MIHVILCYENCYIIHELCSKKKMRVCIGRVMILVFHKKYSTTSKIIFNDKKNVPKDPYKASLNWKKYLVSLSILFYFFERIIIPPLLYWF